MSDQSNVHKEIRAELAAAKARERAMRSWPRRHWFLTGLGGFVVLIVIIAVAASAGGGKDKGTTPVVADSPAADAGASAATSPAASKPAAPSFPGEKGNDKVATPGGEVKLSGWTTTAAALTKVTDDAFGPQLCTNVTMVNRDDKSQSYYVYGWKLEAPSGDTKDVAISAHNNDWGNGDLAPGGSKSGTICFDDPGQPGSYVVLWQPDTFSSDARGAWVNTVS